MHSGNFTAVDRSLKEPKELQFYNRQLQRSYRRDIDAQNFKFCLQIPRKWNISSPNFKSQIFQENF